jgi:membrane-bound lytic murein transglycosylase D
MSPSDLCRLTICAVLLTGGLARAADDAELDVQAIMDGAQVLAQEYLDPKVLQHLQNADRQKVERLLKSLDENLRSTYILDMAQFQDSARSILPLLEPWEETYPLYVWLQTRLDYFDVAAEMKKKLAKTNAPAAVVTNPPPQVTREIWIERLAKTPVWPEAAKPFVSQLKPVFQAEGIPPELIWIAEVESSFNPQARSPAGAVGMFQLMPATAKRYGLRTWPLDHRLRPELSARAAAQYLRFLHQKFGDWRLALAAYNSGEGTVGKLTAPLKNPSFDAIAGRLPAETQLFVPKVEATVLRREGVKLSQLPRPGPITKP